jgi:hypothetical protein
MNSNLPFRWRELCLCLAAVVFCGLLWAQTAAAQDQQSSQQQQEQQASPPPAPPSDPPAPVAKKHRVWTNDDVISLRTPADEYQAQKEAQEAADKNAAEKKAELAKQIKEAGLTMKLPATPEATHVLITDKEKHLSDLLRRLGVFNDELTDATPEKKAVIQQQIDDATADLQKTQFELKVLQDHLDSFPKPKAPETLEEGQPPASPPSTQNPPAPSPAPPATPQNI